MDGGKYCAWYHETQVLHLPLAKTSENHFKNQTKQTNPLDEISVLLLAYAFHLGGLAWPKWFCCVCKTYCRVFLKSLRWCGDPPMRSLHERPPRVLSSSRLTNACSVVPSGPRGCTPPRCPVAVCASLHSVELRTGLRKEPWDSHAALRA